jgi:cell division protease FtsH
MGGMAALIPTAAAKAADDAAGVASSRMSYSRFLEYLDMGRVKKVRAATAILCSSRP